MACEQGDQERIWEMVEIISTGKLPAGHTADDLRAMGLPLPGELYREEQADGTIMIKQRSPKEIEALKKTNTFVCDTPQ
jgi:hypothetical protein